MADKSLEVAIGVNTRGMESGLQSCIDMIGSFYSGVQTLSSKFDTSFGVMKTAVTVFGSVLIGGPLLDGLKQLVNRIDEVGDRAEALSITTESLSSLQFAAQLSGSSIEALTKGITKLNLQVLEVAGGNKTIGATFQALGISVHDANGYVRKADEVLMEVADRFAGYRDGAEKAALATDLFGEELGTQLVPFLNQGSKGIQELQGTAKELGVVFGGDVVDAAAKVNDSLDILGSLIEGVGTNILASFLPALTDMILQFVAVTQAADNFGDGLRLLLGQSSTDWDAPREKIKALGEELRSQQENLKAFSHGEWEGHEDYIADTQARIAELEREITMLTKYADAREAAFSRNQSKGEDTRPVAPIIKSSSGDSGSTARVTAWTVELAAMKELYETENDLRSMSLKQELQYWQAKRQQSDITAKEREALDKKVMATEIAIKKEGLETQKALTLEGIEEQKRVKLAAVEQQKLENDLQLQWDLISNQERLNMELDFQKQIYQIKRQALLDAQLLQKDDLLAQEQHKNALLELERQYEIDKAKLTLKGANQSSSGDEFFKSLENDFNNFGTNLLTSTDSIYMQIQQLAANAGNSMVQDLVIKPFSQWLATQIKQLAIKAGFFGQERVMETTAAAQSMATSAGKATAEVGANAAVAASGAASSQASIPYIGPVLAAAAAASMLAMVLGFRSSIKSARSGYDIPTGVNPIVQLHEEEMVLPKEQANAVRDMAGFNNGPINVNLPGVDAGEFLMLNRKALVKAIKSITRDSMVSFR